MRSEYRGWLKDGLDFELPEGGYMVYASRRKSFNEREKITEVSGRDLDSLIEFLIGCRERINLNDAPTDE
ncbi:hypothetical protein Pla110_44080 [Polystyrenella longa]|uniref:Uncharacterized protein n=1 Tax=Polystyrenella longa TaxID=2528007 RepID=A0A518CTU6_9PLAN|nr:hypothetical protein [Polystyrenella longa]QDU82647.1 hypothetical protein Pla110_44080 [Polystyrenella longa]